MSFDSAGAVAGDVDPPAAIAARARELAWCCSQLSRPDLDRLAQDPAWQALAPALQALARESIAQDFADQGGSLGWPPPPPMPAADAAQLLAALDLADHASPTPVQARASLCFLRQALADAHGVAASELRRQIASYAFERA